MKAMMETLCTQRTAPVTALPGNNAIDIPTNLVQYSAQCGGDGDAPDAAGEDIAFIVRSGVQDPAAAWPFL